MQVLILGAVLLLLTVSAFAGETFRDPQGRYLGSASTATTGVTTYRDAQGRQTGTSATDRFGTTTFRNPQGHITGTATGRSNR